jgi:hypothetical protein
VWGETSTEGSNPSLSAIFYTFCGLRFAVADQYFGKAQSILLPLPLTRRYPEIPEEKPLSVSVVEIGQIVALVGMVLLILSGMGRQRARKEGKQADTAFLKKQRWLHGAAYGLILLGLFLMWGKK